MVEQEPRYWIIVRKGDFTTLVANADDGTKALFVFSTSEAASQFLMGGGLTESHITASQTLQAFKDDLPRHVKSGVTQVFRDSKPDSTEHHVYPIISLMMELDAEPHERMPSE